MLLARLIGIALILTVAALSQIPATAAETVASAAAQDHLGTVSFPTSCSSEAQPGIEKGVALLHSFQYEEARQTFADVETRDAKCAIAHWGQAMALYHQLWDFPDEKQLQEGTNKSSRPTSYIPKLRANAGS